MTRDPAAVARDVIVRGARWLRSDLGDAVRIVPSTDSAANAAVRIVPSTDSAATAAERIVPTTDSAATAAAGSPCADIGPGLDRWSSRLRRRRAAVVARRVLLVALAVALVIALAILATGGGRPLWLLTALLLGPFAGVVALVRAPSQAQTARVLDRGLGLHERLGTALELRTATAAPTGLGAMVVDEATAALGRSLLGARAVGRRTTAEWAWAAALACALGLAIAVPRSASSSPATNGARAGHPLGVGATSPPGSPHRGATAAPTLPARLAPIPTRRTPPPVGLDAGAHGRAVNPYGHGYKGGHLAGKAQTHFSGNRQAGLNLAGPGGGGSADSGGAAGGASRGSAGAGAGGGARSQKLTAGTGGLPPSANSQSHSGAGGAARLGARSGGGAPPGGESAGATRAGIGHAGGVVPVLGANSSGLPLQAGFAPVHGHHGAARGGVSPQANGGGGRGRTATVGAGGAGAGGRFAVIAPTFNAPSPESELLRNYFGGSDGLAFKGW